jgi:DNA end-binding protein Ku
MATKVWKGYVTFGLLSIPVYLNTGARDSHIALTNLHRGCGGRMKMPKICDKCKASITPDQIMKAYEVGDDSYIEITADELEAVQPTTEKIMEITECPKWADVDPMLLAESFYLLPDPAGLKAYSLLVKALDDSGRVAIAQLTKNNREHVVLLRPKGNGLIAHFLYYPNEVNQVVEFTSLKPAPLAANELKLAAKLVDSMATDFDHGQYENGYDMRLNSLIASKLDKKLPMPKFEKAKEPKTMDVTAALMASLERPKRRIMLQDEDAEPVAVKPVGKKKRAA